MIDPRVANKLEQMMEQEIILEKAKQGGKKMLLSLLTESKSSGKNVKIEVKHPGVLEVPKGKNFWQLPLSHYKKLVKKHGYREIVRALTNLEVWNKDDHPEISDKAHEILTKLKAAVKKSS